MKLKTLIETPRGEFEFNAVLTNDQLRFLVEYAIRDLVLKGLIPITTVTSDTDSTDTIGVAVLPDTKVTH